MLIGIGWTSNPENKKDLIKLVCPYFQTDEGRNLFEILLSSKNTWRITKNKTELILRVKMNNEAVFIVAKDADMFLLLSMLYRLIKVFSLVIGYED